MRTHILKSWPAYYNAVAAGDKLFEVRKDDRAFQSGDTVVITYFDPDEQDEVLLHQSATRIKPNLTFKIGFVLRGGQFGLKKGYCAFQLLPLDEDAA